MEGSPPDRPADRRLIEHVATQNCALDDRSAEVRERDGDGVTVHLVLLDEAQQPLPAGPGSVIAVTFAARDLGPDLRAAFADRQVVILR
jgi:hypothetical protein